MTVRSPGGKEHAMPNVDDLTKAAGHAASRQQAVIDAAQQVAAQVAASKGNAAPATGPDEQTSTAPAGGAA